MREELEALGHVGGEQPPLSEKPSTAMPAPPLLACQVSHYSLTLRLYGTARLAGGGHRMANGIWRPPQHDWEV